MSVPIGRVRRLVKRKIKEVIRDRLATEITAALAADDWNTSPQCPAPSGASAICLVHPDHPDAMPKNYVVRVFVYEDGARQTGDYESGGPSGYSALSTQDYRVVVVFQYQPDSCEDEDGNTPDTDEVMRHRADLYLEAVVNAMFKYAPAAGSPCELVELVEDLEVTLEGENFQITGVGSSLWRVTTKVLIPDCFI